jgi:hypothetical protein
MESPSSSRSTDRTTPENPGARDATTGLMAASLWDGGQSPCVETAEIGKLFLAKSLSFCLSASVGSASDTQIRSESHYLPYLAHFSYFAHLVEIPLARLV